FLPAAAQARKEAIDRVAQLGGGDGADADVDLSLAVDFRTDLELGSAAGDGEAGPGRVDRRAERRVQRKAHVQITIAKRRGEPVHFGLRAVDVHAGVLTKILV